MSVQRLAYGYPASVQAHTPAGANNATVNTARMVLTAAAPALVHAVGGVLGFALVYGGASAVIWAGRTSTFPFYTGVVVIVVSWRAASMMGTLNMMTPRLRNGCKMASGTSCMSCNLT